MQGGGTTTDYDLTDDDLADEEDPNEEVSGSETDDNDYLAGNTGDSNNNGNTSGNNGTSGGSGNGGNNGSSDNQGNSNQDNDDNDNNNEEQDNSYDEALKAVEKAEESHSQTDVDYAQKLVDALTDKGDLQKRLDAVQAIIDAETIIARLESNLDDATNRTDVLAVKTDRDESKVKDLLNQITDEETLKDLTDRLNDVSKVVEDNEAPQISGVNGEFTKEDVTITATDTAGNALIATMNGNPYTLGTILTADGTYTVIVRDAAYNEATATFTIDKTAPVIAIAKEGIEINGMMNYASTVTPVITEANIDSITLTKNGEKLTYYQNEEIKEDGTYILTVTDKVGYSASVTFVIDKTAPVGTNLGILNVTHYRENGNTASGDANIKVANIGDQIRVLLTFQEKLVTAPTVVINNQDYPMVYAKDSSDEENDRYVYLADITLTKELGLTDGVIPFTVKGYADALGNTGVELTSDNIDENASYPYVELDTTAPTFNFNNGNTFASKNVVVTDEHFEYMYIYNYNNPENSQTIETNEWLMNTGDTMYSIEAFDEAGNSFKIWIYHDRTYPTITGTGYNNSKEVEFKEDGVYQSVTLSAQDNDLISAILKDEAGNEETICSYTWEDEERPCTTTVDKDGKYTLIVTDRAGNVSPVAFTIDTINPVITGIADGTYTRQDVTLNVEDANPGTIHLHRDGEIVKNYKWGTALTEEGKYEVYVSDLAGNRSETIAFVIDKTSPTLDGVVDGGYYNTDVTLNIIEEFGIQNAKYQKDGGKPVSFNSGDVLKEEGTYFIRITDLAYNKKFEATIVIDKTKPVKDKIQIINNTNPTSAYIKKGDTLRVNLTVNEALKTLPTLTVGEDTAVFTQISGGNGEVIYQANLTISGDGLEEGILKYTISGYGDLAGNIGDDLHETDANNTLTYDSVAPRVLQNNSVGMNDTFSYVSLKLYDLNTITTLIINGKDFSASHGGNQYIDINDGHIATFPEGKNTVYFVDVAGNETTYEFTVDKTAPIVTASTSNNGASTNKPVVVTLTSNEALQEMEGWTKVSDTVFTKEYTENSKFSVTVKDIAGNEAAVNFEVKRYDAVAPTATIYVSNDNGSTPTNEDVTVTLTTNEAIYTPEGWTENWTATEGNKEHEFTKVYSASGKYSVTIMDKAGNTSVINFEVKRLDKTAPVLTIVDPNNYEIIQGAPYVEKGYSACDEVDKDVTHLVKQSYQYLPAGSGNWTIVDTIDTNLLGSYVITYTAYDKNGNTATGTRAFTVVSGLQE